ncbi:putative late blight resistance protein homolog R1B-23 [Coffea eugenioides]|uniref:putative late blight resistance protein homolog R1B-23 n=1 Tax=Coffea eugenioides TaxID=49369 RepID=UPI000F609153|nr:putative late blight resistance protein homolog R1B-23 [Coffea eugenioides]
MECFGKLVKKKNRKKAVKSKNRTSTDVFDSLFLELDDCTSFTFFTERSSAITDQVGIVRIEAELLGMFQMYMANWNNADKQRGAGQGLGSLVLEIEAAVEEATSDVRVAHQSAGRYEKIEIAIAKLQQKLMFFRPQMEVAYEYVASNHSFESQHPLNNYENWENFCDTLLGVVRRQGDLLCRLCSQLRTMYDMVKCLHRYVEGMQGTCPNLQRDLLTHFGGVLVRAAHFSYVCWIHRMDEDKDQGMIIMLSDLVKAFKPNTPQVSELCLKLTTGYCSCHSSISSPHYLVKAYIYFLIPKEYYRYETLRRSLKDLIFFVHSICVSDLYRNDNVKLTLMEIKATIIELGSFGYSFHDTEETRDTDPAFFRLVEKMELLRAEVFLIRLLNHRGSLKFLEHQIDSFHNELKYFRDYQRNAPVAETKVPKLIWLHIKPVAGEADSVCRSFLAGSITEDKFTDELLKLLEKIKLLKTEVLFEELLSKHPSLIVNVKLQIKSLDQGLVVSRTYLMGPLEENEKLILAQVESVARDAACFYYSLLENEITEDTVRKFSHLLPGLVEKMKDVNAMIKEIYLPHRRLSRSNFPKLEGLGCIDFFLVDLFEQLKSKADSILSVKHQFHVVHEEIKFLRSFLAYIEEQYNEHQELKSVASCIIQVTLEAEYLIDLFVAGDCLRWYHPLWLSDLVEDLRIIKLQATETCKNVQGINIHNVLSTSTRASSPAESPQIDEAVIDLADEKKLVIDRLVAGSGKLDVVSIVGMAGLGKTTLAWKVYNDPSITYHFHVQAWCCVSQAYQKRELLLQILGDTVELTDDLLEMSDADLEMKLYRCLKRNKYLIVMDDIWSIEAWYDFKRSFPDDNNGSRILMTSRHFDVAAKIKEDNFIHPLRIFSEDESWELLQKKLFGTEGCPDELLELGKQISRSCGGLPLALVAISGLLKRTDMEPDWWKQVSENICSRIADDPETRCMDILNLSYTYLPDYLKRCFLYTGVFLEDKDIPVRKLTWLWAAEGFIANTQLGSKEDVAERYLRDLIGRSLVMASKRRSDGGVKTCRVHDMLRTLCLRRCEEENFLQWQNGYDELFPPTYEDLDYGVDPGYCLPANSTTYENRRVSIFSKRKHFVMSSPCGPCVRSLLYSATSDMRPWCPYDISSILNNFKLLRVLDVECINMGHAFPRGIEVMVRLRYLALSGDIDSIPESISELLNLEILLVKGLKGRVLLPRTIWSMAKLRHVHVINHAAFSLQDGIWKSSSQLHNLVSFSSPYLSCGERTENIMRRLPKLRKLRCTFSELSDGNEKCNQFPKLNFLTELVSLKLLYSGRIALPCKFDFPLNLRKLTLSKFHLPWSYISEIGKLPNLEVLKLLSKAFEGEVWEMKEGEFLNLKFLKLDSLNLAEWNASSDHLPQLQHLILRSCRQLKEVPSGFGEICTLEMIEVQLCTRSVGKSVRRLQTESLDMGNELKVLIDRSEMDF